MSAWLAFAIGVVVGFGGIVAAVAGAILYLRMGPPDPTPFDD